MPLSPNFNASEDLYTPANVRFLDTSTGSDGTLTSRRISIRLADGDYLTSAGETTDIAYEVWPIADTSITISLLTRSTVGNVTVEWLNGTTVVYTKTILCGWDLYDYLFGFELVQSQTATPSIINDTSYYSKFFDFITNIWSSEAAITYGDDIYSAQNALNRNQFLIQNASKYF